MSAQRKMGTEVVIIGGGIVGCAGAYYLARRGVKVVLVEKSVIGNEASGRNGGGVRQQCRDRRERPLAMASVKLWEGLQAELGFDVEYLQGGNIRMATNEKRMQDLEREGAEELQDGLAVEIWNRDELRRRAPYLSDVFIGAKFCATDGQANPLLAPRAFGWAAKRLGVTLLTHTRAVDICAQNGQITHVVAQDSAGEILIEAPTVVNAAGPWAPQVGPSLGIKLPIEPERSVVAVTQRLPHLFDEFVSSHDVGVYSRQAREGQIHVGGVGTHERTFDQSTPVGALEYLARGAAQMIPALRGINFLRTWGGTIEMTPDKVPVLGRVEGIEGYIIAAGFSGHGFCLGPIAGKLIGELIVEGEPSLALHEFRLERFAEKGIRG